MPKITFDSDEEFTFDEDLDNNKTIETTHDTSDEDSDDDAMPEAVSTKSSRDQAASTAKAQKEAALTLAKADKEKRRLRDQQLKQQKQGSRRELKKQQKTPNTDNTSSASDDSDNDEQEDKDVDGGDDDDEVEDSQRLPQDILDAWSEATPAAGSKRTHMTMADFEAVQAEYDAEVERKLAAQRKKQKKAEQGRKVGEYTVKVLNQRPKVAKSGARLRNMVNSKLHRKTNERENAVLQHSSGRFGSSAMVFRRPESTKNGKK